MLHSFKRHSRMVAMVAPAFALAAAVALLITSDLARGDHPDKGGRPFVVEMTGDAERPGPGHPTATGVAALRLNAGQEEVCFVIEVEGLDPEDPADAITAGHIHIGGPDVPGPIVIGFEIDGPVPVDEDGNSLIVGCVSGDRAVIRDILTNPEGYYVNLHSPNFPPGAVRGQLTRSGRP